MHGALRASGILLDVHPEPDPYRKVEVRMGDRVTHAGRLYRKEFFLEDIRAAREVLASIVSEGLYRHEEELGFDYEEHYDSKESWMTGLSRPRVRELVADDRLIDAACALMPEGRGEIIVTERERATRYAVVTSASDRFPRWPHFRNLPRPGRGD